MQLLNISCWIYFVTVIHQMMFLILHATLLQTTDYKYHNCGSFLPLSPLWCGAQARIGCMGAICVLKQNTVFAIFEHR